MNSDEQRSTGTPSTPPAGYQGGTSTPSTPPAGYPGSGYGAYGQPQDTRSYPSYLGSDQGAGTVQSGSSGDIGSGVVLDTDGHILTNNHVVAAVQSGGQSGGQAGGQTSMTVTFPDGKTAPATVVGTSTTNDLAVIKVDGVSGLK